MVPVKYFVVLVLCVATVSAHLCLLNPAQRGTLTDLNKAGMIAVTLLYVILIDARTCQSQSIFNF